MNVNSSTYYHSVKPKPIDVTRSTLIQAVQTIHNDIDKTYGKRRMRVELNAKGYSIGLYKTAAIMKEANVVALMPRKKHRYIEHEGQHQVAENILNREFNPSTINTHLVGDITYLRTHEGWTYLAAVMDLGNRKIVDWSCGRKADSHLTVAALNRAVSKHQIDTSKLLFHSDRGCQYSSKLFCDHLQKRSITQSMSRKGNCFDNAVMERFFRSLKTERLYNIAIINHEAAVELVEKYIRFYNYKRRHSAIGYVSPVVKRKEMLNVA